MTKSALYNSTELHIHNMMTSSNGNIFSVTGLLCGEFTCPGEFLAQRPVTRSFNVFFRLRLNKRLSKQPRGWWFETPPWSLWRQCNDIFYFSLTMYQRHIVDTLAKSIDYSIYRPDNFSCIKMYITCPNELLTWHTYRRVLFHGWVGWVDKSLTFPYP